MAKYWEAYGCEICNDYPMFVFVVNIDDKDKNYVGTWHYQFCKGSNFVYIHDGGSDIIEAVNNGYYASCEYIIYPDKHWEQNKEASGEDIPAVGSQYFTSKGIFPHDHTSNKVNFSVIKNMPFRLNVNNNSIILDVIKNNIYNIKIFSTNGRTIKSFCKPMQEGINIINLQNAISHGEYITKIEWNKNNSIRKIIIK